MKVNDTKAKLLCVSDAQTFKAEAYIYGNANEKIEDTDTMKLLRFHFSSSPTVNKHLDIMRKRFRCRFWILRHLREAGLMTWK